MTLTLSRPQEAHLIHSSRSRSPNAKQRTDALLVSINARPSGKGVREARAKLAQIAWDARVSGDWATYREVMRRLGELRTRTKETGWKPTGVERDIKRQTRHTSPVQLQREAEQRVRGNQQATSTQANRDRQRQRWQAQALCEALWAVVHGERDWEAMPVKSTDSTGPVNDVKTTATLATPQRLTVFVPELPPLKIEAHHIRLYRAEYERLMEAWGFTHLLKVEALRSQLNLPPGTQSDRAANELIRLTLEAYVTQPAKALPWSNYLSGSRLGAVFVFDASRQDVRLAPRRSGDLRECALELSALVECVHSQPV